MQSTYVIRYGQMGHVARFAADPGCGSFDRGQVVVLRTGRGTELGTVLAGPIAMSDAPSADRRILRVAGPDDLTLARSAEGTRAERLAACERLFGDGLWPLVLVDVEPLLDDRRTVLYYLGPHGLDDAGLREVIRRSCGLDAVLEPVGRDEPVPDAGRAEDLSGCGSGGCGSGGGCGTTAKAESSGDGGCSGCSVKELVRRRKRDLISTS